MKQEKINQWELIIVEVFRGEKFMEWEDLEEGLRLIVLLTQFSELLLGGLAREIPFVVFSN